MLARFVTHNLLYIAAFADIKKFYECRNIWYLNDVNRKIS